MKAYRPLSAYSTKDGNIKMHDELTKALPKRILFLKSKIEAKKPPGQEPLFAKARGNPFGFYNTEEGDKIHFKAGVFEGKGKVKTVGKDGATVEDGSGRAHNVHWCEVGGWIK